MRKLSVSVLVIILMLISTCPWAVSQAQSIAIYANGVRVVESPEVRDGVVYMAAQPLARALGANLEWNADINMLKVNGTLIQATPFMDDGKLMIPLEAVVQAMGGRVEWDGVQQAVRIFTGSRTTAASAPGAQSPVATTTSPISAPAPAQSGTTGSTPTSVYTTSTGTTPVPARSTSAGSPPVAAGGSSIARPPGYGSAQPSTSSGTAGSGTYRAPASGTTTPPGPYQTPATTAPGGTVPFGDQPTRSTGAPAYGGATQSPYSSPYGGTQPATYPANQPASSGSAASTYPGMQFPGSVPPPVDTSPPPGMIAPYAIGQMGTTPGNVGQGTQTYPGAQSYPGTQAYPGAQSYPGTQAYPGAQSYPGTQAYPGAQSYPTTQTYPGTQSSAGAPSPTGGPSTSSQPYPYSPSYPTSSGTGSLPHPPSQAPPDLGPGLRIPPRTGSQPSLFPPEATMPGTTATQTIFRPVSGNNGVFQVTVTNIEELAVIKDYYRPRTGNKFVVLYLSEQNTSNEVQIYTGKFSLHDQSGNTYDAVEALSNFWLIILRPGGTNYGYLVYELPAGARPQLLTLHALQQAPLSINL